MKFPDNISLYKSKERYLTTNYWPISLLITCSKLLKKLYKICTAFYQRMINYTRGFRSHHSCENDICELVQGILKSPEQQKYTIGVFLDLSKAFDTLNHKILFNKMERYGIRGIVHKGLKDYLQDRKIRSKCTVESSGKEEYSDYYTVNYGIPQGSYLECLLFITFTHDRYKNVHYSNCILFADDTTLYKGHQHLRYLKWVIKEDINDCDCC